jgi:hypothetical protein
MTRTSGEIDVIRCIYKLAVKEVKPKAKKENEVNELPIRTRFERKKWRNGVEFANTTTKRPQCSIIINVRTASAAVA